MYFKLLTYHCIYFYADTRNLILHFENNKKRPQPKRLRTLLVETRGLEPMTSRV